MIHKAFSLKSPRIIEDYPYNKKLYRGSMRLLFLSLLIIWSSGAFAAAKIISFVGDVQVLKTGSNIWNKAAVSMILENGYRIKTGTAGCCK